MTDVIFPAEWERHARCWMAWPCRVEAWGGAAAFDCARTATAAVAGAVAQFEPVTLVARSVDMSAAVAATGLPVLAMPLDDSWSRDIAPTFVRGNELLAVSWRFNAWGGKYAPFDQDAAFAGRVAGYLGMALRPAPLVCEGGALHSDGAGTLLTTAQCLLNPNRNPGLSRDEAEATLREFTGAERVVWLQGNFSDAETDGHIDNIACFAAPGRVILGMPEARDHPDYAPAKAARVQLKAEGFEVIELVQPRTLQFDRRGRLLAASYVNFYLCNDGLVMPAFDDVQDEAARAVLAECFPGRSIVQLPALDIIAGGGGIHCITAQQPQ